MMTYDVERAHLVRALRWAAGTGDAATFVTRPDGVHVIGTDGVVQTDVYLGPGAFDGMAPVKSLLRLAEGGPGTLVLGHAPDGRITVCGAPVPPDPPAVAGAPIVSLSLSARAFARALRRVLFPVKAANAPLDVMLVRVVGAEVRLVGTDGHRLSEARLAAQTDRKTEALVPYHAAAEWARCLGTSGGEVHLELSPDCAALSFWPATVRTTTVQEKYPRYDSAITIQPVASAVVSNFSEELRGARTVRLTIGPDGLTVGQTRVEPLRRKGEGTAVVNARYLAEALEAIGEKLVLLEFGGPDRPIRLRAYTDDSFTHYLMPMIDDACKRER